MADTAISSALGRARLLHQPPTPPDPPELSAYLPRVLLRRLSGPRLAADAGQDNLLGAILMVDITGFTVFTERHAERGAKGEEEASDLLNSRLGQVTTIISQHGGDVFLFAGDAALAVWECGEPSELSGAVSAAAACGLDVTRAIAGPEDVPNAGGLQLRASVGAGHLSLFTFVNHGRRRYLLAGAPIDDAARADQHAGAGDVVLSYSAARELAEPPAGEVLPSGDVRLARATVSVPATPPESVRIDGGGQSALRGFVPRIVLHRLDAGHDDWIGEFRTLSVLFINLKGLDYLDARSTARLRGAMASAEGVFERFQGSVHSLLMDDKGTTIVAAFGLPPLALEDGARRAVEASQALISELGEANLSASIGVATGRVFAGRHGTPDRRHYTISGSTVNRAARLMQVAESGVLCDVRTCEAAKGRIAFSEQSSVALKGIGEQVRAFRPGHAADPPLARLERDGAVVGRSKERARLGEAVERLRAGRGGGVLLEGEAGIGKSHLVAFARRRAEEAGLRVVCAAGDAIEQAAPYHPWMSVFAALLRPEEGVDSARARLSAALDGQVNLQAWAPLIEAIVPLGLEGNAITAVMTGESRAKALQELAVALFAHTARAGPLMLAIDDLHWFDSPSIALLSALSSRVQGLLWIAATRPVDAPLSRDRARLAAACERIGLAALDAGDLSDLVARRLGVEDIPDALAALLVARTDGNPLHAEEIALALRDEGQIVVDRGFCSIATTTGRVSDVELPDTVQGVVANRLDRLSAREQLVLKTASVLGRAFKADLLHAVYPVPDDLPYLPETLAGLEQAGMISREGPREDTVYVFHHAVTQDAAYQSLLYAQRSGLHRRAAEALERDAAEAPLLAHHWDRADAPARAIDYLEEAGERALAGYANQEAVAFLERALELAESSPVEDMRRSSWERDIGIAHIKLSNYKVARSFFNRALARRRLPNPKGRLGLTLSLFWHIALQTAHRLAPARLLDRSEGRARDDKRHGAVIFRRLAEVAFFNDETLGLLQATFTALNLAESSGTAPEISNGYGSVGIVAGLSGLHKTARAYMRRGAEFAESSGDDVLVARMDLLQWVYAMSVGDWGTVDRACERGCRLFGRLGDRFRWESCRAAHGFSFLFRSRHEEAWNAFEETFVSARDGALQAKLWARTGQLAIRLELGDVDLGRLQELEHLLSQNDQHTEAILGLGLLAKGYHRAGDVEQARRFADEAFDVLGARPPTLYYTLWGLTSLADVYLSLASADGASPEVKRRAISVCKVLAAFARMFPVAAPRARLYQGRLDRLRGKPKKAQARWRAGLEGAERLKLPRAAALLRDDLATLREA